VTSNTLTVDLPSPGDEIPVLRVAGDLDHHTAPRLREALAVAPLADGRAVVIDLSGLAYCDSTGITVLINAYKRGKAAGGGLLLAGLNANLAEVFQVIGLDQIFTFHPTVEEAVAAARRD
jgi:anti-sigma B factor antagonist